MTTQQTSGTWHRTPKGREWRIDSDWAEENPEGWFVTRMANRFTRHDISDWTDWTEMTLETAQGDAVFVIVDGNNAVTDTDGEPVPYEVEVVAQNFRVEVPRG